MCLEKIFIQRFTVTFFYVVGALIIFSGQILTGLSIIIFTMIIVFIYNNNYLGFEK